MEGERREEGSWSEPLEYRSRAGDASGDPEYTGPPAPYTVPVALNVQPDVPRRWRRRLLRGSLWASAYAAAMAGLFLGGWFAHAFLDSPSSPASSSDASDELAADLFPEEGVTLNVRWGDVPRRLVEEGVIDLEKFKAAAQRAGAPLSDEQLRLLREGSDEPITINSENAYFLLDVLWALGLANNNPILTEGPIAQRGWDRADSYASTGGWTIGVEPGPHYLAALDLLSLTPQQQAVVNEVAFNSYRPCCGNMTAFPDCNHGMAALGLAELMASQGAGADEIFLALKRVSPFWFPKQYYYTAVFLQRQGQDWEDVDPRQLMGRDLSSIGGWRQVMAWLQQEGALSTGPGSGKASGCAP